MIFMDLRRLIASSCRQKILETLSQQKEIHMMHLVRRINSTYNQVNRNLQILEEEGMIKTRRSGRFKLTSLNRENPETEVVVKALKSLGNATAKHNMEWR